MPKISHGLAILLVIVLSTAGSTPVQAQSGGDLLVISDGFDDIATARLPRGSFTPRGSLEGDVRDLAFAPDGRLFGIQRNVPVVTGVPETLLFEIDDQGNFSSYLTLAIEPFDDPLDASFTPEGRFYVLTSFFWWNPPEAFIQLYELDPATGEMLAVHPLPDDVAALAPAPRGLWLLARDRLLRFDSESGAVIETDLDFGPFGVLITADADSTGALWLVTEPGFIDPPPFTLWRFDPATGALTRGHPELPANPHILAIDRRCRISPTARCLQGGRFRAAVRWRDYQGAEGDGRVAPSGSADSGLFWFFEPSNWELLVKVIDGCDNNGHFWVFAAGTTDVEHTLEVTDLATGEVFSTTNTLGQASAAVTSIEAFSGCP